MAEEDCQRPVQDHSRRRGLTAGVNTAPIGVFDSGIGGLSILRALRAELPHEHFVYIADSAFAPYGERDDGHVIARSLVLTRALRERYGAKAVVMACNTATAAAVRRVRETHPDLPTVGVEPALKPAVAVSHTKCIGDPRHARQRQICRTACDSGHPGQVLPATV
jgi:glutamate racemase